MTENNEDPYKILIFLPKDPRFVVHSFLPLSERLMRATIVAYVVPYEGIPSGLHENIPIITWEEPNSDKLRAQQYLDLYEISKAEVAVHIEWPYPMPGASEAGLLHIYTLLAKVFLQQVSLVSFGSSSTEHWHEPFLGRVLFMTKISSHTYLKL